MANGDWKNKPHSSFRPREKSEGASSPGFAATETHSIRNSNAKPTYQVELHCSTSDSPIFKEEDCRPVAIQSLLTTENPHLKDASTESALHHLADVEECFRVFCENVVDSAIVLLDKHGCVTAWNIGAQRLFGYEPAIILGEHYSLFFSPEDSIQRNPEKALRVAARRGSLELQGWHIHSAGQKFWAKSLLLPRRSDHNTLQGFAVITQSLHFVPCDTTTKETGKARGASFIFDSILQQIHDPVFVKDLRGQYIMANEAAARALGYKPHEIIGQKDSDLLPEAVRQTLMNNDQKVIESGHPTEFEEAIIKGPISRIFLTYKAPLRNAANHPLGVIGIARDITQRHYAEKQLRENEERYSWLARHASDMIARHDSDGYFNDVSEACEAVTGYPAGKLIGHSLTDFVHEEDAPKIIYVLNECSQHLRPFTVTYRWRNTNGSLRWLESTFNSVSRDSPEQSSTQKEEFAEISSVTRDVTWRHEIEQEREELLQREQAALCEASAVIQRLQDIQQITDAALTHLRPENIVNELLSRICQLLDAGEANVWLLEENHKFVALHLSFPPGRETSLHSRLAIGQGVAGKVAQQESPLLVPDIASFETGNLFQSAHGHSVIALPLLVEDRLIGVIEVRSQAVNQFSEQHLHLLQLVADRCATTIERARLFEQVKTSQEQMQTLSRRLLTVQEEERRHIARELHDDIGQYLTLAKLQLQSTLRASTQLSTQQIENSSDSHTPSQNNEVAPLHASMLQESIETVEKAIGQVRQLARNLRPSVLDDLGLGTALQSHYERHAVSAGLKFQVKVELPSERLRDEIEIACFRIAQEALTNIIKHARASSVTLILRQQRTNLHLIIEDDGVGFNVVEQRGGEPTQRGIGLLNMEERVHLVNGRLQVHSRVGRGTKVHALFPLIEKKPRKGSPKNQRNTGQMTWTAGQNSMS